MLKLTHVDFLNLLKSVTTSPIYPVYIPETASSFPAICYRLEGIVRDAESTLNGVSIIAHVYNVTIATRTFVELQQEVDLLISGLDDYSDARFLGVMVEDVADSFDPDFNVYTSTISFSVRTKET